MQAFALQNLMSPKVLLHIHFLSCTCRCMMGLRWVQPLGTLRVGLVAVWFAC
jgi:hypothetical protein